jgi:hypothetical protein
MYTHGLAIVDAINAAKTDNTVIALEWTPAGKKWDRSHPASSA